MTIVYTLNHEYVMENGEDEVKALGLYSSRERAEEAIERFKVLPGFCDHPDGFVIYQSVLDQDEAWTEGFIRADPHDALPGTDGYDEYGHIIPKKE